MLVRARMGMALPSFLSLLTHVTHTHSVGVSLGGRWRRDGALLVTSAENSRVKRMKVGRLVDGWVDRSTAFIYMCVGV